MLFGKAGNESFTQRVIQKVLLFIGTCLGAYLVWHTIDRTMGKELPPEPWVTLPPEEWPHFALRSTAAFEGHTPLKEDNAWLVEIGNDKLVAATSRFMLDGKRSVRPALSPNDLEARMTEWKLSRPDRPDDGIIVTGLHGEPSAYQRSVQDCLLLDVDASKRPLPAATLKLHPGMPPELGAKVFVLTCSSSTGQRVRSGHVVGNTMGFIRCRLVGGDSGGESPSEHSDSGAAVLDTRGHLLGLIAGQKLAPNEDDGVFLVHGVRTLLNKLYVTAWCVDPSGVSAALFVSHSARDTATAGEMGAVVMPPPNAVGNRALPCSLSTRFRDE